MLAKSPAPRFPSPVRAFASLSSAVLILASLLATPSPRALALVVDTETASTNNFDPNNGSPYAYVGNIGGASGIYLGNGYVLTAAHVGAGNFTLGSTTYLYDGTSATRLTDSSAGPASPTDLVVFRLQLGNLPALGTLTLATATPALSTPIEMVGYGASRSGGPAPTDFGNGYVGFNIGGTQKSYGPNVVSSAALTQISIGFGNLTVFTADFNTGTTVVEGGDSGGGVFHQVTGGGWELSGMNDALGTIDTGSPRPSNVAVYGDRSYFADIATYQPQINAIVVPEPSGIACLAFAGAGLLILSARHLRRSSAA